MAANNVIFTVSAKDDASKKLKNIEKNLKWVTKQAKYTKAEMWMAGAAIVASFWLASIAIINLASDFEKSMSNISTLVDTSKESMEDMEQSVLDISKRTPVAINDLTSALYDVRSAGIDSSKAMEVLEVSAQLGVAGLGSTKEAADLTTTAINAFWLQSVDTADVADVLFKTVAAGKTDIAKLSQSFGKMAGNAKAANITFEDAQAATAALTALTGKTSESQNALAQVFLELTRKWWALDENLQKQWSSLANLNKSIGKKGLVGGMKSLVDELWISETEFKNLFSSAEWGTSVFQLLTDAYSVNQTALEKMKTGANELEDAYKKQTETFSAVYQTLKNNLNVELIKLWTFILPLLTKAIIILTDWFKLAADIFSSLPTPVKYIISWFVLITTTVVVLTAAFATLNVMLGWTIAAMGALLAPLAMPIAIFAAITAALVGLYLLWDSNFLWIKDITFEVFQAISDFISMTWEKIWPTVMEGLTFLKEFWTESFQDIWIYTKALWEWISVFFGIIWEWLKMMFSWYLLAFKVQFKIFKAMFTWDWKWLWNWVKFMFIWIWDELKELLWNALDWMINKFLEAAPSMLNAFRSMFEWVKGIAKDIFNGVIWTMESFINKAIDWLNRLIQAANRVPMVNIPMIAPVEFWRLAHWGIAGEWTFGWEVQKFAQGGVVQGAWGLDNVPAMLTAGEVVLNASQQRNLAWNLDKGWTSVNVTITWNSFYWDDENFAEKIGNTIMQNFKQHMSIESF